MTNSKLRSRGTEDDTQANSIGFLQGAGTPDLAASRLPTETPARRDQLLKALVWAGVVQGMLSPPLMLLIMLITTNRKIMGKWVNTVSMNVLGWLTAAVTLAAAIGVVCSFVLG